MSLLTVCQDVCAVVGVMRPTSIFSGLMASRTQQELLALANEMAQRIAYDGNEWGRLEKTSNLTPGMATTTTATYQTFPLPADFKRMLLTTNVRRQSAPTLPMRFIADTDQWILRRTAGYYSSPYGEWILTGTSSISIAPPLSTTDSIFFPYLSKNCINVSGGSGDVFLEDFDTFMLDERLLKLAMIWQWKAHKGTPYAEDLGNYQDALDRVIGTDKPAPIIVGSMPMSAGVNVAFPWPADWGSVTR